MRIHNLVLDVWLNGIPGKVDEIFLLDNRFFLEIFAGVVYIGNLVASVYL